MAMFEFPLTNHSLVRINLQTGTKLETVRAEPVEACSSRLRDTLWLR
jgi:hypothetical protein